MRNPCRKSLVRIGLTKGKTIKKIQSNRAQHLVKLYHLNSIQRKMLKRPSIEVLH